MRWIRSMSRSRNTEACDSSERGAGAPGALHSLHHAAVDVRALALRAGSTRTKSLLGVAQRLAKPSLVL
eukprot:2048551-Pyramimonas_sp.AAC.1